MNNEFYKPYLNGEKVFYAYNREDLIRRPVFPTIVFDGGAFFFANDKFGTTDGDFFLEKIMDGSIFDYWKRDGKLQWDGIYWDFRPIGYSSEWEGHIWLNRLYILLPLAHAYLKTKDEKYAQKWLEILRQFIIDVPYTTYEGRPGDLLWRDMQVTWRTITLMHSIFMLGENTSFNKEDWDFVYDTVKLHGNHIIKEGHKHAPNPGPDNHILQIGTAITMLGCLFPEFFDREEALNVAKRLISFNMETSIYSDGCNNEDSLSYSHFIARLYLEAELLLKYNNYAEIEGLHASVQKQYEFLYKFSSPAGKSLQIGDSYAFDAVGDVDFINSFYPLGFKRERKTTLFEGSRMAYLENGDFSLYVDAMDMDEWHQHFGRPHFLLYYKNQPLVIDSGSVNYDRGYIRKHLNSEKSHNVIYAEEIPLTKKPSNETLKVLKFEDNADVKIFEIENNVTGENKGYNWVRRFELYIDRLEIIDTVKATEKLNFVSKIFLPDCRVGYTPPREKMLKEEKLRFGSFMETITTDTPFEVEFTPCVDEFNRMNYAESLVRKFNTDAFLEKTVIRFDKIHDGMNYYLELTDEWKNYFARINK